MEKARAESGQRPFSAEAEMPERTERNTIQGRASPAANTRPERGRITAKDPGTNNRVACGLPACYLPLFGGFMFVFHSPRIDALYNLALEEHLLLTRTEGDYLLLWQSDNTVVIGRHQNFSEEINLAAAEQRQVTIVRRTTGGGAVYHDEGNLNFSFITASSGASGTAMQRFTLPVITALRHLGLNASLSGRNDIVADGAKVSGNAQRLYKNRILHHGTLLFDSNLDLLSAVLKVKPEKFRSKSAKSVRSRVANINSLLSAPMSMGEFAGSLLAHLTAHQNTAPLALGPEDEAAIEERKRGKYASDHWTRGRSPACAISHCERFEGGFLDARLTVRQGVIAECVFYGDFMALLPAEEAAKALLGVPYSPKAMREALGGLPLDLYFGTITLDEVVYCLCAGNNGEE